MNLEPNPGTTEQPMDDMGEGPPPLDTGAGVDAATSGSAPETVNLVPTLTDEERKEIGEGVWTNGDRDWKSSERYRKHRDNILKLYLGIMPSKEDGFSQIHFSIVAKAVQRLHSRVYDQQFPSNGEFWGCAPTDATDLERCVRVSKHMNWQTSHQIKEYIPNHDILILQWYLYGSAFSYMYWDAVRDRPCHVACRTEDIILPYARSSSNPSLPNDDVPRVTRILRKYRWGMDGIDALAESGYYDADAIAEVFEDKKDGHSESSMDMAKEPIQQTIDKQAGVSKPEDGEKDGPRVLWEQHCWLKFGTETRYRPVIATIDRDTRKLIGLMLREDEDPQDRARYNREKLANDAEFASAMAQYEADFAAYLANQPIPPMQAQDIAGPGVMAGEETMTVPPAPGMTSATEPPIAGATDATMPMAGAVMPQPPQKPPEPAPPKMVPIAGITHYICMPNPEGVYGLGIGWFLEGQNIAADSMGAAMVDAAYLSNTATGIRSRMSKMDGGELKIIPGTFVEVDVPPEQIDKVLHQFKFPPPEPMLGQFIRDMKTDADELSGASDILSGEVGGSNETATTTQIRISQALAAISIQNKRYTRSRTVEGQQLARLNSVHLGDNEYFTVVDPFKRVPPSEQNIGRLDYLEDVDITVTADPRMASQPQRVQEATQAFQMFSQIPIFAQNPTFMGALAKNLLVAMDRPELIAALETPPPPPSTTMPGDPSQQQTASPGGTNGPPPASNGKGAPGGGSPRPQPPGPTVPNAGPTPANGEFMNQGA